MAWVRAKGKPDIIKEDLYVLQNGYLVQDNYTTASRFNTNTHTGRNTNYGYYAHSSTSATSVVGATVTFPSKNYKYLYVDGTGQGPNATYLQVTGDDTVIYGKGTTSATIDIQNYSTIVVRFSETEAGDSYWIEASLKNIILKDE